jgi:CRP/FNR family transcriptional regulator
MKTFQSTLKQELRDMFSRYIDGDERLLDSIVAAARLVKLDSGSYVFHSGDHCESFLLLVEGSIRVRLTAASGREVTLYRIAPGGSCILTTSCLLGDESYPAEAITESNVVAVAVPRVAFEDLLEKSKPFRRVVFAGFATRLKNVIAKIDELSFTGIDARLARVLLACDARGVDRITHQEISVELGTAREVVSRHLKRFELERWVDLGRGRVVIVDRAGLEKIAALSD